MSSRALRRLQGETDILSSIPDDLKSGSDDDVENPVPFNRKKKGKKKLAPAVNPFELLLEDEDKGDADDNHDYENKTEDAENTENMLPDKPADENSASVKPSKKKKKKKHKKARGNASEVETSVSGANAEDEIEASIREVNRILGVTWQQQTGDAVREEVTVSMRALLNVEHRYLNPDTEMKRIFGSRVVQTENMRQRNRNRTYQRAAKLTQPRDNWPPYGRTGLSMSLVETKNGCQVFTFEHSHQYQQIQYKFQETVDSLNPQNIANLLQAHPYHIDSLIQLSEVFKMTEDMQMAAELIERALYAFESAFHPSFSLTVGTCRVDFRRQENRALYLCLFKHLVSVGQRGCYRTALEFCKLLLGLDPDGDPMCVLLMIDFYALRAKQYSFLIRMYQEWEAHRNLTQLPNFAFSVPLAMYHTAEENEESTEKADEMLQKGLLMFPGILMPLLDKCSVNPDSAVSNHSFFQLGQQSQTEALKQLIALYVGRCFPCWKEPEVISWLERNVKEVLRRVDNRDPIAEEYSQKRKVRYQGTPRNIYRHIIVSEIKDATAALPPELTASPVLNYDPLPPADAIISYSRPSRPRRAEQGSNALSLFLRSLLPNFNPDEPAPEEGATGGDDNRNNLRRGVGALMDAMRDLLNNIQPVPPPVENQHNEDQDEERNDEEWD